MPPTISPNVRKQLITLFSQVSPFDDQEKQEIEAIIKWISTEDQLYRIVKPATPPRHLSEFNVPFDHQLMKICLFEHNMSGLLLPPGGHCESDEMPYETAAREINEELGIKDVKFFKNEQVPFFASLDVLRKENNGHTDVDSWYVFEHYSNQDFVQTESFKREFSGVHWMTLEEALEIPIEKTDQHLHRFVKKLQSVLKIRL